MKRILTLFLIVALIFTVFLPVTAQTDPQAIPFSGWAQGETGNAWEPNAYIPGLGQVVLCQTTEDLTAYLQAGDYPLDYAETYGYDAEFFAEKSLLLLEVGAGRPCDYWYVTDVTQIGNVLNCNLLYYEPDSMGPDQLYSRIQCVELNEKPNYIQRLHVTVTYDKPQPKEPLVLDFAYGEHAVVYDLGDVDGNGQIAAADALLVLKSVVGKAELTEIQQTAAKTSADDTVDAQDALCILQKVVGKIRHFPIEITPVSYQPWQQPSEEHYVKSTEYQFAAALLNNSGELSQKLAETLNLSEQKIDELCQKYTDEFFAQNSLLAFTVYAPCTGAKYMVNDLYAVQDQLYLDVSLYETYSGGLVMEPRVYFVELEQKDLTAMALEMTLREHSGLYGQPQTPLVVNTQSCPVA